MIKPLIESSLFASCVCSRHKYKLFSFKCQIRGLKPCPRIDKGASPLVPSCNVHAPFQPGQHIVFPCLAPMKIATKTQRHKVTLKGLYINESFVPSCLCGNHFHRLWARPRHHEELLGNRCFFRAEGFVFTGIDNLF